MKTLPILALAACLAAPLVPALAGAPAPAVQDFRDLPQGAYGPYAGPDCSMSMALTRASHGAVEAAFHYDRTQAGWCGEWIRAGSDWQGQDWSKAKGLVLSVRSSEPLQLRVQFNDGADQAYLSPDLDVAPGAWRTLTVPFSAFGLNPYYQPAKARKGAPLDLTHVVTFNLQPDTPGKHSFWVARVGLE